MEKTYSQAELDEKVVQEVRKAIEHRATWMYLLLKEARERGLDWDEFARPAIWTTGCLGGHRGGMLGVIVDQDHPPPGAERIPTAEGPPAGGPWG